MRIHDSSDQNKVAPSETVETGLLGQVIDAIKTVYDPEIPVNLYDLGLIYNINIDESDLSGAVVTIDMTLTNANCPVADDLVEAPRRVILPLEGVARCKVNLVWEPKWNRDMMCEEAQLHLGFI